MSFSEKRRKISAYMPDHLSREILLRLPVKSVLRFRTVCKGWCSLISNGTFITNHLAISKGRSDVCLLGCAGGEQQYFLCRDDGNGSLAISETKIALPSASIGEQHAEVVGFCNGLACVGIFDKPYYTTTCGVVLWNPIIKKHMTIKTTSIRADPVQSIFGFGFDSIAGVYKLVNFHLCQGSICVSECWLGDGEWRMCIARHDTQVWIHGYRQHPVFVNGKFHILVHRAFNNTVVMVFDLQTRGFVEIGLPNFVSRPRLSLHVFKDSLSLCTIDYCVKVKRRNYLISLWKMDESSWTKVFVSRRNLVDVDKILGLGARGEVVYSNRKTGHINSYDPITKSRRNFGIRVADFRNSYIDSFEESLVLLNDDDSS